MYVKTGRLEEAGVAFQEVIRREMAQAEPDAGHVGLAYVNLCDIALIRRNLEDAGPTCATAVEWRPNSATTHYNLAVFRMLSGDRTGALDSLKRDVDLGDSDHVYLLEDDAFLPLHGDPRFKALIEEMRGS